MATRTPDVPDHASSASTRHKFGQWGGIVSSISAWLATSKAQKDSICWGLTEFATAESQTGLLIEAG